MPISNRNVGDARGGTFKIGSNNFTAPCRASYFRPQFTGPKIETSGNKPDMLIVDELGYLRFSRAGAESLFQAFAGRYECRSLLTTNNLAVSEWGQISQSERMTAARQSSGRRVNWWRNMHVPDKTVFFSRKQHPGRHSCCHSSYRSER